MARPLSLREFSSLVGKSYEHCRKIALGEPVVSLVLNAEICKVLLLEAAEMWDLARQEKAKRRFGDIPYTDIEEVPVQIRAIWERLGDEDRGRVLKFAEALAVSSGVGEPIPLPFASRE